MKILAKIACGLAGVILGIASVSVALAMHRSASPEGVLDAVYPLYSQGITWSLRLPVTLPPLSAYNPTKQIIEGSQVSSLPTASTKDIGQLVGPFRDSYDQLLLSKGWTMDTNYEADGPGGSLWGFTKGNDILILSYTSTFYDDQPGRPKQCPCTVVFTIIGGTLK